MRKVMFGMAAVLILVLAGSASWAEGEAAWLDPANCYMCKPLTEHEGLLENSLWENFPISNGMISVSTVKEGYLDAFRAAGKAMEGKWTTMDPAKEYQLCGMCQAWMVAWDETVKHENVLTSVGSVSITTSDNPETVAKLHEITERTTEEMKKWMEMEHKGHDHNAHEGHGH